MTVSQRASGIYKLIKPSGGTWQEAMAQAYEEIAREEIEREDAEARQHIKQLAMHIRTRNAPHTMTSMNNLLADIVESVVENNTNRYRWSTSRNRIDPYESTLIELMYDYSKGEQWDSAWRSPTTGKISTEWYYQVIQISDILDVDITKLRHYDEVKSIFV